MAKLVVTINEPYREAVDALMRLCTWRVQLNLKLRLSLVWSLVYKVSSSYTLTGLQWKDIRYLHGIEAQEIWFKSSGDINFKRLLETRIGLVNP